MAGHILAKTHVYKSNVLLWELIGWLDLSSVFPWSSAWSLTLLSLDLDQLYARRSYLAAPTLLDNDATVNTGGSLAFPFLLLSDQSYSFCCRRSKFSTATMSHIQITNALVGYCWRVVKPFIAVLMLYKRVKARHNGGALIMGERGCAAASLWLEHAPSIGLAIGPRQVVWCIFDHWMQFLDSWSFSCLWNFFIIQTLLVNLSSLCQQLSANCILP